MKKVFLILFFLFFTSISAFAQDAGVYIDKAISAIENNDLKSARENFQYAMNLDDEIKNSPELNFYYAKLLELEGDYDSALQKMLFAIELNTDNPAYYLELGKIYLYKNDYLKAVNALQYALSDNKNMNAEVYNYLGIANYRRSDIKTALDNFEHADEINPNNILYMTNLLFCYKGLKMDEKAKETMDRIDNFKPITQKDFIALSRVFYERKNYDECKKILKDGIKQFPNSEILKDLYNKLNKS